MKSLLFDTIRSPVEMNTSAQAIIFLNDRNSLDKVQNYLKQSQKYVAEFALGGVARAIKQFKVRKSPQLIVVDISAEELPLSRLKELQEVCLKETKLIVIGELDSVSLYRDLIDFGALEYIIKPIPLNLLQNAISRAFQETEIRNSRGFSARNIALVGVAGGIGSSSIASSLGEVLSAKLKRKTLLLDCQNDAPALCTHFNKKMSNGLGALCADPARLDKLLVSRNVEKISERLDLLSIDGITEPILSNFTINMSALFPLISESYHYVLSDMGYGALKGLIKHGVNFTSVVFISDMRLSSLVNLERILKAFTGGEHVREIYIVLNQSRGSKTLEITANQAEKILSRSPDAFLRNDSKSFAKSTLKGVPVGRVQGKFQKDISVIADLIAHHTHHKNIPKNNLAEGGIRYGK